MIHFSISHVDYNDWPSTHRLSTFDLQRRADAAAKRNEAVWLLGKAEFAKWRSGLLTPWLVPDHLTVTAGPPLRTWPILASQLRG